MKHQLVEVIVPFDHEVYRSHCTQHFGSCKRPDFVGIKQVVVMTDIAVSNRTKVTVVTTPNTPDELSNHVILTCCAFFQRLGSPNLHCNWKWSQFYRHCQALPTPSWKELSNKLQIQHQLHRSLRAQDLSDVANHLYCMIQNCLFRRPHHTTQGLLMTAKVD